MKQDIPEKGAIIQRDRERYGVAPHIPAGIVTPELLKRIAEVAERYGVAQLKLTSAQRIALLGFAEEDLEAILADLGEKPGAAIGLCVRSVKVCPGTDFCKRGQQDSIGVGLEVDRRYHGMQLPWKFKMGVSGCANDCGEACIKDVGLIGSPRGWHLMVGGNGGSQPRLARRLLENLPDDAAAMAAVDHVVAWFRAQNRKCRLGKFIDEMGFEAFREEVLKDYPG